jgi:S-formylglutathione hydrolase
MIEEHFETDLVPGGADYGLLLPEDATADLPLLYLLHGGGGDRGFLEMMTPLVRRAWEEAKLPPLAVATPSAGRSFYMDTRDGRERWETLLVGPLLEELRRRHPIASGREKTALCGVSMGGMGSLRMALKYPDRFLAVAALEPGIEPSFSFAGIEPRDRFYRPTELFEHIYGSPVGEEYWQANNPANLARDGAEKILKSGLAIYLECGDQDSFGLHRGAEFLHRLLFDAGISHEYRLVRGAEHVGVTLGPRFLDAFSFLGQAFDPPPPDETLEPFHQMIAALQRAADGAEA